LISSGFFGIGNAECGGCFGPDITEMEESYLALPRRMDAQENGYIFRPSSVKSGEGG
jgi:hypothetical protein